HYENESALREQDPSRRDAISPPLAPAVGRLDRCRLAPPSTADLARRHAEPWCGLWRTDLVEPAVIADAIIGRAEPWRAFERPQLILAAVDVVEKRRVVPDVVEKAVISCANFGRKLRHPANDAGLVGSVVHGARAIIGRDVLGAAW